MTENAWQWIAITLTAAGLLSSTYYNQQTLNAVRTESEVISYLGLSERYHDLVFELLRKDPQVFQHTSDEQLGQNKYVIYQLIDLLATVSTLDAYHHELRNDVWPEWERRMRFVFSKPAVRFAWTKRRFYAQQIYTAEFTQRVDRLVALDFDSAA